MYHLVEQVVMMDGEAAAATNQKKKGKTLNKIQQLQQKNRKLPCFNCVKDCWWCCAPIVFGQQLFVFRRWSKSSFHWGITVAVVVVDDDDGDAVGDVHWWTPPAPWLIFRILPDWCCTFGVADWNVLFVGWLVGSRAASYSVLLM